MSEEQYVALPKLYGAPAYARPPRVVPDTPRPEDVDDLPLEAFRDSDDVVVLPSTAIEASNGDGEANGHATIQGRPFSIKSLSRFLSSKS